MSRLAPSLLPSFPGHHVVVEVVGDVARVQPVVVGAVRQDEQRQTREVRLRLELAEEGPSSKGRDAKFSGKEISACSDVFKKVFEFP